MDKEERAKKNKDNEQVGYPVEYKNACDFLFLLFVYHQYPCTCDIGNNDIARLPQKSRIDVYFCEIRYPDDDLIFFKQIIDPVDFSCVHGNSKNTRNHQILKRCLPECFQEHPGINELYDDEDKNRRTNKMDYFF